MEIRSDIQCCGIHEISDIIDNKNEPKYTIKEVCKFMYEQEEHCTFLIFSDVGYKTAGKNLEKFILENNLGEVTKSGVKKNPNSNHLLQTWTWAINQKNLRIYYLKNVKGIY